MVCITRTSYAEIMKHISTGPHDVTVDVGDMVELHLKENTSRDYCWFTNRVGAGLVLHDVRCVPSKIPFPGQVDRPDLLPQGTASGPWPVSLRMRRLADLDADRAQMTVTVRNGVPGQRNASGESKSRAE